MTGAPRFAGAVLCGGASRRMGADKALLELDGRALARRVADALEQAGAQRVLAIGGDADRLAGWQLDVVADHHPGGGPLGGIITALGALAGFETVAVLGCDLLRPSPDAIRAVVDRLIAEPADVAVPVTDGWRHFDHAAWRTAAAPELEAIFNAGERAPRRAAASLRVADVEHLAADALADADDPATLAAARRRRRDRW